MSTTEEWPITWLRERLGYAPRDPALFTLALTHRSAPGPNNERLEFLGDAVLNLLIAERLFREFPHADEGDLSRLRARIVSEEPLARVATDLALGEVLRLGAGELKTGGFRRQSILADAFEAVCGALYLDAGLPPARAIIEPLFERCIDELPEPATLKDAKTLLQEHLQARGQSLPRYVLEGSTGEAHAQVFHVRCESAGAARTTGSGSSRRRAEQEAAARMLERLGVGS